MWLIDRSRYVRGTSDCGMARYLEYHSGPTGYGMRRAGVGLPTASGSLVHEMLAGVMRNAQLAQQTGTKGYNLQAARPILRQLIAAPIKAYKAEVEELGYLDSPNKEQNRYVMEEQAHLMEALAWCFVKTKLEEILENYEILAVEEEETIVVGCTCEGKHCPPGCHCNRMGYDHRILADHTPSCQGICVMTKPDLILREKLTGKVVMRDFKTDAYGATDNVVARHQDDVQMAVQSLGTELRLGEPVQQYSIDLLIKGKRGIFSRKGVDTSAAWKKTYSGLCYAKTFVPNAPFTTGTTWDHTGFWIDKQALWEVEFTQKPREVSNAEFWVFELPDHILFEQTAEIGPYERLTFMIPQALRSIVGEEAQWIENLNALYPVELKHGWASDTFQQALDMAIPRSYDCRKYGLEYTCQMYDICFRQAGWQDPLGSGKYIPRRPHHQPEIDQMLARGIPVPPERKVE